MKCLVKTFYDDNTDKFEYVANNKGSERDIILRKGSSFAVDLRNKVTNFTTDIGPDKIISITENYRNFGIGGIELHITVYYWECEA